MTVTTGSELTVTHLLNQVWAWGMIIICLYLAGAVIVVVPLAIGVLCKRGIVASPQHARVALEKRAETQGTVSAASLER